MTPLVILPNWNSLDSVRNAHSDLELAGLVFFALLVVAEAAAHNAKQEKKKHLFDSIGIWFFAVAISCEIAGYWYGLRNDTLSERVIESLDVMAKEASTNASKALTDSETALTTSGEATAKAKEAVGAAGNAQIKVDAVGKRAEEIDADLAQTQWLMSARQVQNRDDISADWKKNFKGREVFLWSYMGDQEAWGLCTQLWYIAEAAEMKPVNNCGKASLTVPLVSPLSVFGPDANETTQIAGALVRIGRLPFGTSSGMGAKVLTIFVGVKSPFMIGQGRGVKAPAKMLPNPNNKPTAKP